MSSLVPIAVPGLSNLRDLGGLRTRDGRRTRSGHLLRSATPFFLTAAQALGLVTDLRIRLRVDLRSRGEISGATNVHLAAIERDVLVAPLRSGGLGAVPDITDPAQALAAHYLRFLEHAGDSFAAVARALADPGNLPALLHCTLGKDRTGAVAAVMLAAVGVTDEEIVTDYVCTQGQTDEVLEQLRALPEYARRLDELPAEALSALSAAMTGFLAELNAVHGGGRGYLSSLGVEDAVLDALTHVLVEEASA